MPGGSSRAPRALHRSCRRRSLTSFVRRLCHIMNIPTFIRWPTVVVGILGVSALTFGLRALYRSSATEYRSYMSPDGRFKMVIYRLPMLTAMPGQSSDAPGFVRLYDQKNGRILQQKDVEMVQIIDQFEWTPTNLYITLFADWRLPP